MKYIVVKHTSLKDFTWEVNNKLASGYVCQGGICYDLNYGYIQAMILSE